ncbi:MAG: sulfotransferase [Erythrobacter sp.]
MLDQDLKRGLLRLRQREFEGVHGDAIDLIKQNVANPVPYFLLGVVASEHGNHSKALELFDRSAGLDPSQAYFRIYHAKTLSTLARQNAAKHSADQAAMLAFEDPFLLDTLGVIYSRAGYHQDGIPFFERAVKARPNEAMFHYNLAASAQFQGDFETAKHHYEKALELDRSFYRAWPSLVSLEKQTSQNNRIKELTSLFSELRDDADAKLQIGHAIAKTFEDLGEYEQSLDWLIQAKRSKRSQLRYDRAVGDRLFAAAASTCRNAEETAGDGGAEGQIFVVGLPRTGTTLVDRILSSHAKVSSAGELNLFAELVKDAAQSASNLVLDEETLKNAQHIDFAAVGNAYAEQTLPRRAQGAHYLVDKMPLNFFYAGLIQKALPQARIIALRRGAMDSCLSNFRQLFSTRYSYYNYTFDLEDTAHFFRSFDTLMSHWRSALPADRFMEVNYEDIVFDQETQTRKLLDFCSLDWDEACMRFHENKAPVSTASSVQVRQPLYTGSIERWKKYGSGLDRLRASLGDLVKD